MARRRRSSNNQNDALAALIMAAVVVILVVVAVRAAGAGDWRVLTMAIGGDLVLVGFYLGFLLPRQCGAERAGRPGSCGQRAHGVMNGCRYHPFAGLRSLLGRPTSVSDTGTADPVYGRSKERPRLRTAGAQIVVKESRVMMAVAFGQLVLGFLSLVIGAAAL